jgi:hypothetical protein
LPLYQPLQAKLNKAGKKMTPSLLENLLIHERAKDFIVDVDLWFDDQPSYLFMRVIVDKSNQKGMIYDMMF